MKQFLQKLEKEWMEESSPCPLAGVALPEPAAVEAAEQIIVICLVTSGAVTSLSVELLSFSWKVCPLIPARA